MIKSNVKKVEILLWKQIISADIWDKINKFHKKLKSKSLIYKIFKILFVLLLLVVVGIIIYFLFI
jgi:type IV secretory pathway component VirB8